MNIQERAAMLHNIGKKYVVNGLGAKNFDAIPYDENVSLRAPLTAGGSWQPLTGKERLKNEWWGPLPTLVGKTELIDSFVNNDASAVTVEFHCEILNPCCTLRIIDRFKINEAGLITEQENFFDPRAVTNPPENV
ncbi:hypothetical protein [Foetidibacter luteolus]|uniref:hypothetical protein n=1 Tax=Foetidibacter luteolus TaxID=2608880 RepID=UPI00129B127B|nr:hypothetical protein [Foetidibacter luteolus]